MNAKYLMGSPSHCGRSTLDAGNTPIKCASAGKRTTGVLRQSVHWIHYPCYFHYCSASLSSLPHSRVSWLPFSVRWTSDLES